MVYVRFVHFIGNILNINSSNYKLNGFWVKTDRWRAGYVIKQIEPCYRI